MNHKIHILVNTIEQLNAIYSFDIDRIYIDSECAYNNLESLEKLNINDLYLASPYILRKKDEPIYYKLLNSGFFKGVLVRNLEELGYLNNNLNLYSDLNIVLDSTIYLLNQEAVSFIINNTDLNIKEYYNSYELTEDEIRMLTDSVNVDSFGSCVIYGRIPMMISANCVNKTLKECKHESGFTIIDDRLNNSFYAYHNCLFCYNVIYNTVPTSLHRYVKNILKSGNARIDFTNEDEQSVLKIYKYFKDYKNIKGPLDKNYTNGLYKRGVE